MTTDTKSITLATAKDNIDAPDGKVAAAYKLAREKKPSGRLNLSDIKVALKQMQHHPPISFSDRRKKLAGYKPHSVVGSKAFDTEESVADAKKRYYTEKSKASGGSIKRRGGGIAKRGMGIAK